MMSQQTIVMAAAMLACCWMTSQAEYTSTYKKASGQSFAEPEMTVSARSRIHCAIACRKYPHCTAFAYDNQRSSCLLRSAASATSDPAKPLSWYTDESHCPHTALNISHGSVTLQRSLWSVEGNVTCDDDYFILQNVTPAVTCLANGRWTSINAQCVKRVWRYPKTNRRIPKSFAIPIPGTLMERWSVCVNGVPTDKSRIVIEIMSGSRLNRPVHTSWRFEGRLVVNDMVNSSWGKEKSVRNPPFPLRVGKPFFFKLTVNTSTTVDIFMDNVFFYRHYLKFPPSSFSHINIYGGINVTKVETWCKE